MNATWASNLRVLGQCYPELRRRLTAPGGTRIFAQGGAWFWRAGLCPVPLDLEPARVEAVLPRNAGRYLLAGAGAGEIVEVALARGDRLVVWDRDPSFLRPLLSKLDLGAALEDGRLTLAAGADLLDFSDLPRVVHPVLGAMYRAELAWSAVANRRVLVVDGGLFVDDVCEALRRFGVAVFRWDVADVDAEELDRTARRVAPERVIAINHTHGLPEACERLGVPLSVWEIDPATDRVSPATASGTRVFTWRAASVSAWRDLGYLAEHLPLAADPEKRSPGPVDPDYAVPLAYVGSSMVARARELVADWLHTFERVHGTGSRPAGEELVHGLLAAQRDAGRSWIIPDLLRKVAPGLDARFAAAGSPHRPDAALGEAAAAEDRLRVLGALGPLGLNVWGDPDWANLSPRGVRYRGWAGHHHELTRIYRSATLQIDVNRLYQRDIVPMRIFDALACGAFILAEHSEELARCFDLGVEVVAWRTPTELYASAERYLQNPEEAHKIALRGRQRVLRDHTVAARVARLLVSPPVQRAHDPQVSCAEPASSRS